MGVFFRLGDVGLRDVFGGEVFGEDVGHGLRGKGDGEGVGRVVGCHCCEGDVGGVRERGERGAVDGAEELGGFADAVGAVVEVEEGVVVCEGISGL